MIRIAPRGFTSDSPHFLINCPFGLRRIAVSQSAALSVAPVHTLVGVEGDASVAFRDRSDAKNRHSDGVSCKIYVFLVAITEFSGECYLVCGILRRQGIRAVTDITGGQYVF